MAKTIIGTVTSDKADKTIVITIQSRKTHPLYKKQYTVTDKFMAHDEKNQAKVGDKVSIVETKPLSANKRFKLEKVIEKAGIHFAETDVEPVEVVEELKAKKEEPKAKAVVEPDTKEEKTK
jgi:small subunit ribosomal protein S17